METEHGNLRAVLQLVIDTGDAETGLRLAKAVWEFLWRLDQEHEALHWYTALLALPEAQAPSVLRAHVLTSAALMRGELADSEQAALLSAEALSLCRSLGDKAALARALWVRAGYEPLATKRTMLSESLALHRQTGNTWGAARALSDLADIAFHQDMDLPAALSLRREASNLARASGDTRLKTFLLYRMATDLGMSGHEDKARSLLAEAGVLAEQLGDRTYRSQVLNLSAQFAASATDAVRLWLEALAMAQDLGHRHQIARWLSCLGEAYCVTGDLEAAESCFGQGLALSKEIGDRVTESWAYRDFARLSSLRGDNDGVLRAERQALSLCARGFGNPWHYRFSVEDLAHRAVAAGDWRRAARLMGAVAAFDAATGFSRDPLGRREKSLTAVREHMDNPEVAEAWAEGQAMSIEQAGLQELREMDEAMT